MPLLITTSYPWHIQENGIAAIFIMKRWEQTHPSNRAMSIYLHNVDASYNLPFGLQIGISYLNYQNPSQQYLEGTMLDEERILYTNSKQVIDKWLFTADQSHT